MEIKRECIKNPLSKQPLALVLIQIRYTPIINIVSSINNIQELLRKDFPQFEPVDNISVVLTPDGIKQENVKLWSFTSISGFESILIDQNQITFQVTDYNSFECFFERFNSILQILDKQLNLSKSGYIIRYGLRYVDQIIPLNETDSIDSYLNKNFVLEQPDVFKNQNKICNNSVTGQIELCDNRIGSMSITTIQGQKGMVLPPDLMARAPVLKKQVADKLIGLIDMDASFISSTGPEKYEESLVKQTFYKLHDRIIDAFFKSVISEEGKKKWE